ncbi:MAG: FlgD immunoglobulin-like domain containing protein [Bacteroidia bacterium]
MKKRLLSLSLALICLSGFAQPVYKDVAQIFYTRCASCHNPQRNAISFLNYSSTKPWAATINTDLTTNRMPPLRTDTTYTRFLHENKILPSEKTAILNWITNGALKGDTTQAPPAPSYGKYRLSGIPDLELTIPTFTSNAAGSDSYVCFSLPTGLTQDRIIKAFEITPGDPSIVHHVVVNVDSAGYSSSDLSGSCYAEPGDFSIGAYAPGSPPTIFPGQGQLKMGIRIQAGSKLVLQIHYPAGTVGKVDSTKIRLYFYPVGTTGVRPVFVYTPLQNWTLNIPKFVVKTYTATENAMSYDRSILAVFPHSHKVAKTLLNYAVAPGDTIPLCRINDWDFNFQGYYTFKMMPKVPAGHQLFAQHVYDNTTAHVASPAVTTAGFATTNEMLFDGIMYLTYQPGDELINIEDIFSKELGNVYSHDGYSFVGINEQQGTAARPFTAYAFPNPFSDQIRIGYTLGSTEKVNVEIYSMLGVQVKSLQSASQDAGVYELTWDGRNDAGIRLPAGNYLYKVSAGNKQLHGKISLLPAESR